MKFVVDMNLSPDWVATLQQAGYDAVHWSNVGAANASDDAIMIWARHKGTIVLTSDLDLGRFWQPVALPSPVSFNCEP